MGRSDYLVSAGIGFDLDRASAKKSIGIFEGVAGTINTIATKSAAKQFAETEKDYEKTVKRLEKINTQADIDLIEGTEKSAKAAQAALDKTLMKAPSQVSQKVKDKLGMSDAQYAEDYKKTMKAMKTSYKKFQEEASKIGLKFSKKGKLDLDAFAKKDLETRKQAINLTKRMIKDEKARLKTLSSSSDSYKVLKKEIEALERQEKAMVNVAEDRFQLEKKADKTQRNSAKEQREADKKRITAQKKIQMGLKNTIAGMQKLGRLAQDSAAKIKGGLTNAFVIGTAAATAFFYKMQPLAEQVTEFEKTVTNANSVFNVTKKELYEVSDSMVQFTLKYGVSAQDTATGLYQLASAGLSAAESQEVLKHTMKLAMATQGDHNTLAKLTVQTIMGFGMEMEQAGELTDKFAHTIQKSLVEWQDLSSSVKFAMPFFTATGQSINQLLGGIEVLSNRALEAGIAGRGLRQALAQFAKHANDNESALSKLGVTIMDTEGNMRELSEIALDAKAAFGDVTDLEALTAMLKDMNVRGATAFALLVQNADEYKASVEDLANSTGEATQMADIQQQSLVMQMQRVKNALLAPFLLADTIGEAQGSLNEFTLRIKELVDQFTEFFIIIGADGQETYSEHGKALKEFVIVALNEAVEIIQLLKNAFLEQNASISNMGDLLRLATMPLKMLLKVLDALGPNALKMVVVWKAFNALLPITNILTMVQTFAQTKLWLAMSNANVEGAKQVTIFSALMPITAAATAGAVGVTIAELTMAQSIRAGTAALWEQSMGWAGWWGAATAGLAVVVLMGAAIYKLASPIQAIAIALIAGAAAWYAYNGAMTMGVGVAAGIAATAVGIAALKQFFPKHADTIGSADEYAAMKFNKSRNYDGGGTYIPTYDNGGMSTEHGMAIVQKGETIVPKTQNMLGSGGITLNMGDVSVHDGEDFAERVAAALPDALRRVNDSGAI